jgi:hypothetical protein
VATKEKFHETKQRISDKGNRFVDKIFPAYDSDKPDTESNKKRFKEHLEVNVTEDVKNIYSYGDFMGIDYKVLISFQCDSTTIEKIVRVKGMTLSTQDHDEGLHFLVELPWWNKEKISSGDKPYKVGKEYEYWEYLWYDRESKTAYYEEFSL